MGVWAVWGVRGPGVAGIARRRSRLNRDVGGVRAWSSFDNNTLKDRSPHGAPLGPHPPVTLLIAPPSFPAPLRLPTALTPRARLDAHSHTRSPQIKPRFYWSLVSSEVQSVRLSRSSCMMRVESLYDSSSSVSSSAIASSKACFARSHAFDDSACTS